MGGEGERDGAMSAQINEIREEFQGIPLQIGPLTLNEKEGSCKTPPSNMTFSERHASIAASHRGQEGAAIVPIAA
jgi:hypothetical protein